MAVDGAAAASGVATEGVASLTDGSTRVAALNQTLWAGLAQGASLEQIASPWLSLQVGIIGAASGAVYRDAPQGPDLVAVEPQEAARLEALPAAVSDDGSPARALADVAAAAIENSRGAVSRADDGSGSASLAQPLVVAGETVGAAAVELRDAAPQRVRAAMRQLLWGTAWLRERIALDRAAAARERLAHMHAAHDVFAAVLEEPRFRAASLRIVTQLAHLAVADRVSVGFRRLGRTDVAAVSHSAEFGRRMSRIRQIGAAMDEAIDQRAALVHPPPADEVNSTRAHAEFAREHRVGAILTVPFLVGDSHLGAFTFERSESRPFTPSELALLDFIAALAGPALWEKRANDKWLLFKAADSFADQLRRLCGPGHLARKLTLAGAAILVALFSTWSGHYRVSADAVVEGEVQRDVVAPFDGFVREAKVRAGDMVSAGALIASLDDRDLALERLRWASERRQRELEYGRAIGEGNRSEAEIIRVQILQADAEIELIDAQMSRAHLAAPFDGVVVSGDQSQNIGGAVRRGDVLFEIAPLDAYRIVLEVDESRIGDVAMGRTGALVVTGLPETSFSFVVEKLTPIAIAEEGRNFFRTEARLTGDPSGLRPGMEGIGKIDVDDRLMISIWTRSMIDWVKLTAWRWFG